MTSANFEVELESLEQIKLLFGSHAPGGTKQFCDGNVELKLISTNNRLAFDSGFTVQLIVSFSVGVASGVVANAIYAAISIGIKRLEINGRRTRITEESIAETLEKIKTTTSPPEIKNENQKNDSKNGED